jgi:Flp pilus assembly protein TadB
LGTLVVPLIIASFYGFGFKEFPSLRPTLNPLFGFALAWSLIGLYVLNRRMWSSMMPGDAGFSTGLEFCRGGIERQRDILLRVLLWSLGPVLLAIGTFILVLAMIGSSRGIFPNAIPFLLFVVVWILTYFVIRFRDQRQLQRESDELNEIDRHNSR